jgi:uncharacterized PurR-regulated membrane protein YhhQ (DUF165 family)
LSNKLSNRQIYSYAGGFALIIVLANFTVQFPINSWLTYGALMYPLSFLATDILSEKYSKKDTLKVVRVGVLLAIIPTILVADGRIAFASITTFFLTQQLDVLIFYALKKRYLSLWWLRNNGSTITSQFFDTTLFFFLAFGGVMPFETIVKLIIGDYLVKVVLALLDTPFFYLFAIKLQNRSINKT